MSYDLANNVGIGTMNPTSAATMTSILVVSAELVSAELVVMIA